MIFIFLFILALIFDFEILSFLIIIITIIILHFSFTHWINFPTIILLHDHHWLRAIRSLIIRGFMICIVFYFWVLDAIFLCDYWVFISIIIHPWIFDYPILFSYYHYFQSLGISGILLAIICSLLSIIYLFRFICQRHYLQSSHIDAVIIYLFRNRAIKINIINARIGEK